AALSRPREDIAALSHKRATLAPLKPPTHRVLPIRSVQRHFPDVVPPRSRTPRSLDHGHALEGLFEVWSMPRFPLIRFVQQYKHEFRRIHAFLLRTIPG